jgi:hypothetical protein
MKLPRRKFLHLAAGTAALPLASRFAWAQAYPSRPVRVIVGFTPGSAPDIVARLMSQWLSERLGQQFVIDNKPGGGGNIGTEAVVRAPAGLQVPRKRLTLHQVLFTRCRECQHRFCSEWGHLGEGSIPLAADNCQQGAGVVPRRDCTNDHVSVQEELPELCFFGIELGGAIEDQDHQPLVLSSRENARLSPAEYFTEGDKDI